MNNNYFASLAILVLASLRPAHAADIYPNPKTTDGGSKRGFMIEGKIVPGDFVKFVNVFIDNPIYNDTVYLYSPGGDFEESLKIGRLVHALKLTTWAPWSDEISYSPVKVQLNSPDNAVCASSCFFIFAAGAERHGDIVGIHRPYLPKSSYKNLSMDEAGKTGEIIRLMISQYLKDVDVPDSFTDRIMNVDSGGIEWLSKDDVSKYFNGLAPAYRDWMLAKCMPASEATNVRARKVALSIPLDDSESTLSPTEMNAVNAYFECRDKTKQKEIFRHWTEMVKRRSQLKSSPSSNP